MIAGVGLHKKLIAVLLTAFLAFGITGCDAKEDSNSVVDSFEPVNVPECGWTVESLAKTIRVDGNPIDYPFIINNLGKEFKTNEEDTQIFDSGTASTILYKNDIPILTIEFQNITSYSQIGSAKPSGFSTYYVDYNSIEDINKVVSINGIQIGASKSDIESAFGQPDSAENNLLLYKDRNTEKNCVGFWLNDNDVLYSFTVILD